MFLYSCFFLAMNLLDPALDRHRLTFRDKLGWARAIMAAHMGFGMALFVLMWVPIVNMLAMPGFVVAGTLMWVH